MLTEEAKAEILRLREAYPDERSALMPALHLAQRDYGGWLPAEAIDEVAAVMGLTSTRVGSMASFYSMFNRQPVGRHLIYVCTNVACSLLGGQHLLAYLSDKLGVAVGETTADGAFTLLEAECLGSCGTAPMMQVDDAYYENLTEEKVDQILADLASGDAR